MTTFLFIPGVVESRRARRVDFGNIASLFVEAEEPARHPDAVQKVFRVVAAFLLVLLAVGDTLLVARTFALTSPLPTPALSRASL